MNGDTKIAIKNQLINWVGIAIVCIFSFYFTANATLKQHDKDIDKKLDTELFDMYIVGINKLIDSNCKIIKAYADYNKEQIELLRAENKEIREDVKLIIRQMDFKTRGNLTNNAN